MLPRLGRVTSRRVLSRSYTTIQAAVARQPKEPLSLEVLQLDDPKAGELLVRVAACGICHTDIAVRDGHIPSPKPLVLGHEGVGVVEQVGEGVTEFRPGDRVLMSYASCGHCSNCLTGKPSYCSSHRPYNFGGTRPDGTTTLKSSVGDAVHGSFFHQSALATHAIATERNAVKLPGDVELERLAPLGCGVQTGAGAVFNSLRCTPGSAFAVFGAGSVGLSAILAARTVGVGAIIAVDLSPSRLELAGELGATHVVQSSREQSPAETASRIREALEKTGRVGLDFALDTTGVPAVLRSAFELLRPTGVAALCGGSPAGSELSVDMTSLLLGRTVRGVIQGDSVSRDIAPKMIELWRQGRFPFDKIIHFYDSLSDVNQAIEDMESGKVIKPVIRMQ